MSVISDKFNAKISALKSEFEINRDIVHQGIKGGLNENEISNLISEIIPKKFKVSKGIIENAKGEQSNETDFFIYDDEILPPYIKNDLAFVPVEAIKYVFEVKSTLNSTELKSTISKFSRFSSIGGRSPTILFAFSSDIQGSELERYRKNNGNFYTYPDLMVLCVSNKGYYFKSTEEKYLKDYLSIEEYIKRVVFEDNAKITTEGRNYSIKDLQQSNVTIKSDSLKINGLDYSEIKFKVHKWLGVEDVGNIIELLLLSGVSNTLCKESFGSYLLHKDDREMKVFSICYEDMWGNISAMDFDQNGLKYNTKEATFNFSSTDKGNKLIFDVNKQM